VLAELTGGALEVTVRDSRVTSRIWDLDNAHYQGTGREHFWRALKLAFDPSGLLLENTAPAFSNGSSP
jgi:hypothetical protein